MRKEDCRERCVSWIDWATPICRGEVGFDELELDGSKDEDQDPQNDNEVSDGVHADLPPYVAGIVDAEKYVMLVNTIIINMSIILGSFKSLLE